MADAVEAFLNRLQHPVMAGIDLSLERMLRLLAMLGSPQKRLPPVIHVAGTNGKGSLLAYLQAIFEAAGYRVHRYTSPHLVRFSERIILQGKEIEHAYLETILKHVAQALSQQTATFFEATTAAAFLAFAERPADLLLLETGMGGRLDATNVIEKPLLTAITPIALDHTEFLGSNVSAIAAEKAGILKRGVPCVVGRQEQAAAEVIAKKAQGLNTPLFRLGQEWRVETRGGERLYWSNTRTLALHPSLVGAHQFDNAATAVACMEQLPQFSISDAQIAQGLASTAWPARLQRLEHGRYDSMLPPGVELWLDGGHNPQGGEMLAQWLKERGIEEIYLVCGMVGTKDMSGYFKPLAPLVRALYAVAIPGEAQSRPAAQVQAAANAAGIEAQTCGSVENALQSVAQRAKTPALACICGSLYLAGKILATN